MLFYRLDVFAIETELTKSDIIMQQSNQQYTTWLVLIFLTSLGMAYLIYRRSRRHQKIRRKLSDAKKREQLQEDIIVIAIQIDNLIVLFSEKYRKRFKLLDTSQKGLTTRLVSYVTNARPCFFERFTRKAIRKFFKDLKALQNTKLVLYTRLPPQFCEKILMQLSLQSVFEDSHKIYTRDEYKYASEVDHDTRRVIIVTANRQDQDRSIASYHMLILELGTQAALLDQSILINLVDCLTELTQERDMDNLHENMHQLTSVKGLPVHDDEL